MWNVTVVSSPSVRAIAGFVATGSMLRTDKRIIRVNTVTHLLHAAVEALVGRLADAECNVEKGVDVPDTVSVSTANV